MKKKTTPDFGRFTFCCAHRDGEEVGRPRGPLCGKPATRSDYGMDRCDDHAADLEPANWPANRPDAEGGDRGRPE